MFKNKLRDVEKKLEKLEKEKQELLFIKNQLDEVTPKIDISDVFIWKDRGIHYIVRISINSIYESECNGIMIRYEEHDSTLTDIFSNQVIYHKKSRDYIKSEEAIHISDSSKNVRYAYCNPIYEYEPALLAYPNKLVPLYVLQRLLYRLNNVDVNASILKK